VFSADDHGVLQTIEMMNADQKRASFSATPIFADLRQVTNELEEARQYSILADGIQQDRSFLLSSYESVLLAPNSRAWCWGRWRGKEQEDNRPFRMKICQPNHKWWNFPPSKPTWVSGVGIPAAKRILPGVVVRSRPWISAINPSAISRALCSRGITVGGPYVEGAPIKSSDANSSGVSIFASPTTTCFDSILWRPFKV
jgi:hypothetical protein